MRELDYENLSDEDKEWMRSRNMPIPGEGEDLGPAQSVSTPGAEDGDDDSEDYNDWNVPTLQQELRNRELPTSGNKAELVARLQEDDEAQG